MKIGLLGGSFNPPHKGHLHISLEARRLFDLEQIWWLPTKQNPLKTEKSNFDLKLKQCQEITKGHKEILVKDYEKNIPNSYVIDLLKELTRQYPQHQFYFILGADSIVNFHLWHQWQEIIKLVPLLICNREGYFFKALKSKAFLYAKKLNRGYFLRIKKYNISSTQLRSKPNNFLKTSN